MKASTAIGIAVAIFGIMAASFIEGSNPITLLLNKSAMAAMCLVFVGTAGVTIGAVGMDRFKSIPRLYKRAFSAEPQVLVARVHELSGLADVARRDGLLALEGRLEDIGDDFTRKGLQLVVDGTDPKTTREVMEAEIDAMAARHRAGIEIFKQAGGFAPTLGVIGTCIGLVHVLGNLSQPETLGPLIAGAFIATLLGVGSANVVYLPVAARLKALSEEEQEERGMVVEGVIALQAGENPRAITERLLAFVPPAERATEPAPTPAAAGAAPLGDPVPA